MGIPQAELGKGRVDEGTGCGKGTQTVEPAAYTYKIEQES